MHVAGGPREPGLELEVRGTSKAFFGVSAGAECAGAGGPGGQRQCWAKVPITVHGFIFLRGVQGDPKIQVQFRLIPSPCPPRPHLFSN